MDRAILPDEPGTVIQPGAEPTAPYPEPRPDISLADKKALYFIIIGGVSVLIGAFLTDISEGFGAAVPTLLAFVGGVVAIVGGFRGIFSKNSDTRKTATFIALTFVLILGTYGILNATIYDESMLRYRY